MGQNHFRKNDVEGGTCRKTYGIAEAGCERGFLKRKLQNTKTFLNQVKKLETPDLHL